MLNTVNYLVYLGFSIFITVFVSRTLSKNGLPFLIAGFKDNDELAISTNHLLVVGFYLVNLGFVLLRMKTGIRIDTLEQLIVYQSSNLGVVLLVLGLAHFFNMYIIHWLGRSGIDFRPAERVGAGANTDWSAAEPSKVHRPNPATYRASDPRQE